MSRREARRTRRAARLGTLAAAAADGEPCGPRRAVTPAAVSALSSASTRSPGWPAPRLVFVLLGTGAVFAGVAVASVRSAPRRRRPPRPGPPDSVGLPTASRLRTCCIAGPAADPRLMTLSGSVLRADTGEVLWDHKAPPSACAPPA